MVEGGQASSQYAEQSMGRMKYSEEERNTIIKNFLNSTREIIHSEGIDQVSIRKVAARAGLNSATMYLYFTDSDELITLACMGYLEDYCNTLICEVPQMKTVYDAYMRAWEVFSIYAFQNPQVFHRLFFYPHSKPLKETAARYFQIYPEMLEQSEGLVHDTLLAGTLSARNMKMLRVICDDFHMDAHYADVINDFTICYFKNLLEEMPADADEETVKAKTRQLLEALKFLFWGPRAEAHSC